MHLASLLMFLMQEPSALHSCVGSSESNQFFLLMLGGFFLLFYFLLFDNAVQGDTKH